MSGCVLDAMLDAFDRELLGEAGRSGGGLEGFLDGDRGADIGGGDRVALGGRQAGERDGGVGVAGFGAYTSVASALGTSKT